MRDVVKIAVGGIVVFAALYIARELINRRSAAWKATYGNPVWSGHSPGPYTGLGYTAADIRSDVYYE